MVRVVVNNRQGLVQKAGGGMAVSSELVTTGQLRVKGDQVIQASAGSTEVALRCKREVLTMANASTTTDTGAGFIPANSLVVACGITLVVAGDGGGHSKDITDWGLDGDPDFFNVVNGGGTAYGTDATVGTAKIGCCDSNVAVSDNQAAAAQFFLAADIVRITHGNVGAQDTACEVAVDLWYYDLSDTSGS